jgi:hypothetical protein
MFTRYVYSINGEDYFGAYETRSAAESAAIRAAQRLPDPPSSVFVARSTLPDPRVHGFARPILSRLIAREAAAGSTDGYLSNVTESELQNLDVALEAAILGWLARHDRAPSLYRIEAVSEIPLPPQHEHPVTVVDEVYDLGVEAAVL